MICTVVLVDSVTALKTFALLFLIVLQAKTVMEFRRDGFLYNIIIVLLSWHKHEKSSKYGTCANNIIIITPAKCHISLQRDV